MAIIFKISVLQNTQKPYDRNGNKTGRFLLSKYGSSQNFKTLPIFKCGNVRHIKSQNIMKKLIFFFI